MQVQKQDISPAQDSSLVDQYLSASDNIKLQIKNAIGAKNDDEAISLINTDTTAAQEAKKILSQTNQDNSVLTSKSPSLEDVMYPQK